MGNSGLDKPAPSRIWLKDSAGHPSVSITMLTISFWVTTIAFVLSIVHKIGSVEIRAFDVGACGAYFGLILSTYVARRWTEARYGNPNIPYSPYNSPYQPYSPYGPSPSPYNRPWMAPANGPLPPLGVKDGSKQ